MTTTEIRVRPVIRHMVTRHTSEERGGSLETLGEFTNEGYAEQVAEALRGAQPKPMQYAAIERRHFDIITNVCYFDVKSEAELFVAHALANGREFRLFLREVTDPVKLAHHEVGMIGGGCPSMLPPELPRRSGAEPI